MDADEGGGGGRAEFEDSESSFSSSYHVLHRCDAGDDAVNVPSSDWSSEFGVKDRCRYRETYCRVLSSCLLPCGSIAVDILEVVPE